MVSFFSEGDKNRTSLFTSPRCLPSSWSPSLHWCLGKEKWYTEKVSPFVAGTLDCPFYYGPYQMKCWFFSSWGLLWGVWRSRPPPMLESLTCSSLAQSNELPCLISLLHSQLLAVPLGLLSFRDPFTPSGPSWIVLELILCLLFSLSLSLISYIHVQICYTENNYASFSPGVLVNHNAAAHHKFISDVRQTLIHCVSPTNIGQHTLPHQIVSLKSLPLDWKCRGNHFPDFST